MRKNVQLIYKHQETKTKIQTKTKHTNYNLSFITNMPKHEFDLEKRTTEFAKQIIILCGQLPRSPVILPIISQIVRSAGSIGANYREANDSLGKKDFIFRLRIVRKETKETLHWLYLLETAVPEKVKEIRELTDENIQLRNIFSAMINNAIKAKS
jgi:four helix bundle protein